MNEPAPETGEYQYKNADLGFELALPAEFIYYQTQRKTTDNFVDIEFFVPTGDENYYSEVFGYTNPVTIRIFDKDYYENQSDMKSVYKELTEKNKKVYTIRFWENIPSDWRDKWNDELKQKVIDGFMIK
ncbi:hypothetical protein COV49_04040 [Candidatus Falkowbacteria bacterium CG11_big_fil_rev_8_21_14_0_20_39_10]|uniref:Uncharacterized protein n=1 Tax=Candidatus Falkowbacteria bacterium CG11_big_fil_rev_8_21_14_0_20_39_10 TaxID=1974570 RepID=A0A2M6K841_9BACT|nr:MAG: hypothetical protein COV49_04040 [Candidatus Falkowbacteria bacterium CG11_big_fil_rev_8_21_14_0_20_39_10]